MAIYRGEGGATDVEPAPGDTEFAGGIIVEGDILSKGKITAEEGFYGDGSSLTNLPNDNVWKDNGSSIEFKGNGATTTQIWAENNGKYAKVIQKNDGQSYFKGDGATFFGTDSDLPVNIFVDGTNQLAVGKDSVYSFQPVTAPSFIGNGSLLTDLPTPEDVYTKEDVDFLVEELNDDIALKVNEAPEDGKQYARQDKAWTEVETPDDTYTKAEIDAQQNAQDTNIVINNDEIARQQIEITNNSANITKNDDAINKNIIDIATNTSAIAGLSGAIVYKGNINVSATDAPAGAVSGDMYVNDYNALEPDTSYPVTGWGSITSVVYADRVIRTDTDWEILPVSGGGSVPTDTYTKAQIDEQQGIQDSNISSNTSAIGTLSGQVGQNSEDIAELQDSIFFSSAYSADYPSAPNRDPENGNMYLQNVALFTYSYATATQIFASKTDESGNVRQFTAIQAGDSIVLNEVDSPNYGRYELVSVEDVSGSYVVMNVIPKKGQGTVITGVKVAFQAFPKPATVDSYSKAESDAIDDAQDVNISANTTAITTKIGDAPVDGKEYARKDANWTEVTGGTSIWTDVGGVATYDGAVDLGDQEIPLKFNVNNIGTNKFGMGSVAFNPRIYFGDNTNLNIGSNSTDGTDTFTNLFKIQPDGTITDKNDNLIWSAIGNGNGMWKQVSGKPTSTSDITVNGVNVGRGSGDAPSNIVVGPGALDSNITGTDSVAIGQGSLTSSTAGIANTGIGENSLAVTTGNYNTSIGRKSGDSLTTGNNNTFLGHDAQPSAPGVSNEVTIGSVDVTTVRMGNGDIVYPAPGGGTLDIDALPALPTELEGTDLFVTERTGTNYKVTADGLSIEATPPTYATWNPSDAGSSVTLSFGNLMAKMPANNNVAATIKPTSGKWYWEVTAISTASPYIGIKEADSSAPGYTVAAVGVNTVGDIYHNTANTNLDGLPGYTTGDVIGHAWDADAKKLWWSKNGQWYTANAAAESAIDISEVVAGNNGYDYSLNFTNAKPYMGSSSSTSTMSANFGQLTFSYPAPTGFNTISTEG